MGSENNTFLWKGGIRFLQRLHFIHSVICRLLFAACCVLCGDTCCVLRAVSCVLGGLGRVLCALSCELGAACCTVFAVLCVLCAPSLGFPVHSDCWFLWYFPQ